LSKFQTVLGRYLYTETHTKSIFNLFLGQLITYHAV